MPRISARARPDTGEPRHLLAAREADHRDATFRVESQASAVSEDRSWRGRKRKHGLHSVLLGGTAERTGCTTSFVGACRRTTVDGNVVPESVQWADGTSGSREILQWLLVE
jgi:hypothetical protein